MNKSDLITKVTERLSGDRTTAVAAVNGVLEEIQGGVARGERVSLTGFGTFERRERAPRTGRNPRTGQAIQVGPSVVPVFRAGTGFRAVLGQGDDVSPAGSSSSPSTTVPVDGTPVGEHKAARKARDRVVDDKGRGNGKKKDGKDGKEKAGKGRAGKEGAGKGKGGKSEKKPSRALR